MYSFMLSFNFVRILLYPEHYQQLIRKLNPDAVQGEIQEYYCLRKAEKFTQFVLLF